MSDRFVRQIDPRPKDEVVSPKRISDYSAIPNIVLVGDPGAGKSHLFEELARAAKTTAQNARAFLNAPPSKEPILFIDALDERRAGRTDQATIDLIVQKLFAAKASYVRLACREHDWLGGTDLAAFHPYFAQSGGHVVLALEPLTEIEQRDILKKTGVAVPQAFIREAERRGLSEFLINPQNLIMLAEAVLKKGWPATRKDLFEDTTVLLLKEHNVARVRTGGGQYAVQEVRAPAGAVCALRLISDVEGISLVEAETDPLYPSYRTVPFCKPELTLASLGRRVFRALGNEAVDYSHRIRAEYAAAGWLAQKIRDGLPLSRVQALIGIDGVPAPELRGMHAWLALLLPEFSDTIIDADPFGVLIYSDASSLALTERVRLLRALAQLAAADPYFRPEERGTAAFSALCRPDMVPHLRKLLADTAAPFGIKQLVLEALSSAPLPNLQKEIVALVADPSVPFGLKVPALRAVTRLGGVAVDAVVKIYKGLGWSPKDIRLRAYILAAFYVGSFSSKDVSDVYNASVRCEEELVTGVLWQISTSIPTQDIPKVLDAVAAGREADAKVKNRNNRVENEHFVERLIVRALDENAEGVSGRRLWTWLKLRSSLHGDYNSHQFDGIKPLLAERLDLTRDVFLAAVEGYSPAIQFWLFTNQLREFLPFPFSAEPLRWLASVLAEYVGGDATKRDALYELAFSWVYGNADNLDIFEFLYYLADAVSGLKLIRDKLLATEMQGWHAEDKQRAAKELQEREAGRLKNLRQFSKDIDKIKDGTHQGWMIWAADVYFANFRDVDETKLPRERLEEELGPENTVAALEGLKTLVHSTNLPSLQDLAAAVSKNSYPRLWFAFLAGMDELWLETPSLTEFSDHALKSLVCIDLLLPTLSRRKDKTRQQDIRAWKDHVVSTKPALVKDAYLYLAEAGLKENSEHSSGLYGLLNDPAFVPFRGEIATHLLEMFPGLSPQRLEELLHVALTQSPRTAVTDLARTKLDPATALSEEQRQLWLLAAYLLSPNEYRAMLEAQAKNSPAVVWRMRALTSYDRDNKNKPAVEIKPLQRELFIRIAAAHYPNADYPVGGWSGDENAWDASEFVRGLLSALSADMSTEAIEALQRLALDPVMTTYTDNIKHAVANQRARYREMNYKQPNWAETIATLSGETPANVADLQALVVERLREISKLIGTQNIDVFKQFWNEDPHGRPMGPKTEESARNVLLGLLKARLDPLGVISEPEGHMVADKRADITSSLPGRKLILELKRDIHPDLWNAPGTQLDRFYTRDLEASGFGIFGVFWYGDHRHGKIPKHPTGKAAPRSAVELETMLNEIIAVEQRSKLRAVVIDVSIPDGQVVGGVKRRPKKRKNLKSRRNELMSAKAKKTRKPMAKKKRAKRARATSHKRSSRHGRANVRKR